MSKGSGNYAPVELDYRLNAALKLAQVHFKANTRFDHFNASYPPLFCRLWRDFDVLGLAAFASLHQCEGFARAMVQAGWDDWTSTTRDRQIWYSLLQIQGYITVEQFAEISENPKYPTYEGVVTGSPTGKWQRLTGGSARAAEWTPFPDAESRVLETAFTSGQATARLGTGEWEWQVTFADMRQRLNDAQCQAVEGTKHMTIYQIRREIASPIPPAPNTDAVLHGGNCSRCQMCQAPSRPEQPWQECGPRVFTFLDPACSHLYICQEQVRAAPEDDRAETVYAYYLYYKPTNVAEVCGCHGQPQQRCLIPTRYYDDLVQGLQTYVVAPGRCKSAASGRCKGQGIVACDDPRLNGALTLASGGVVLEMGSKEMKALVEFLRFQLYPGVGLGVLPAPIVYGGDN